MQRYLFKNVEPLNYPYISICSIWAILFNILILDKLIFFSWSLKAMHYFPLAACFVTLLFSMQFFPLKKVWACQYRPSHLRAISRNGVEISLLLNFNSSPSEPDNIIQIKLNGDGRLNKRNISTDSGPSIHHYIYPEKYKVNNKCERENGKVFLISIPLRPWII